MRVGIPRALLYYWYGPAWKTLLTETGHVPVVSAPTNKAIMNRGLKAAVDEICLPVKVFIGHSLSLQENCDAVLVPRLTSIARKEYICPKFMGLPDMVRRVLKGTPVLSWKNEGSFLPKLSGLPREFFAYRSRREVKRALKKAEEVYNAYTALLYRGYLPQEAEEVLAGIREEKTRRTKDTVIGIVGHPYCIYDSFVNIGLLQFLHEEGRRVMTPEMVTEEQISSALKGLPKPLYWTMGKKILGAARVFRQAGAGGLIHVAAFACGPEALIGELVKRESKDWKIPFLQLYLDEHSGEAGLHTRLEAFLDLTGGKEHVGCI